MHGAVSQQPMPMRLIKEKGTLLWTDFPRKARAGDITDMLTRNREALPFKQRSVHVITSASASCGHSLASLRCVYIARHFFATVVP